MCDANASESKAMLNKHPELQHVFHYEDEEDEEPDEESDEDETLAPVRTEPKIGRNDPCPCGSGKKYKRCCGNS